MRLLSIVLVLLAGLVGAQVAGKTEAQILKMGMDGWTDYYTRKVGGSTADMCRAAGVYGEAARHRTDRMLRGKPPALRTRIFRLRNLLMDFDSASIDCAYAEAGGGTMYNPMWASVVGEVEDTLYALLGGPAKKAHPRVVSDVSNKLDKIANLLEAMHKGPDQETFKYDDAKKALAKMRASYGKVVDIAKGMKRVDSDRVLDFCFERAENAAGEEH